MGQTQLLLIILGVLLIGVAIYLGTGMFAANAEDSCRESVIQDLTAFSTQARTWYSKSISQGGGNRSFSGITIRQIFPMIENQNARYYVESATAQECVITGVGKILSSDDSVRVRIRVTTQRNIIEIVN
jgi:hypothetical protein